MLELSVPEQEPLKAEGPPPQAETPEEEEEYTGNKPEGEEMGTLPTKLFTVALKDGALGGQRWGFGCKSYLAWKL